MLNSVILMGRLTKEPISNKIGETTITNFDIAVDNARKEADGTRGTTFFTCKCFGAVAESIANNLHKGSKVALKGSIQQRNFIRKDGTKGTAYEVYADSVEFLDQKPLENSEQNEEKEILVETPVDEPVEEQPSPKYDPFTGKPLKPTAKK